MLQHEIRGQYAQLSMENSNLIQLFLKDKVEAIERQFKTEDSSATLTRAVVPQQLEGDLSAKKAMYLREYLKNTEIYRDETVYKLFEHNIEVRRIVPRNIMQ